MILRLFLLISLLFQQTLFAQEDNFDVSLIPETLKENANAIIRLDRVEFSIESRKSMIIKKQKIVTVINESGFGSVDASEYYNKSTSIKLIEAIVYDQNGKLLKKIKRKDFKDVAISQGSTLTDNRGLYLDYTPVTYPFTIVFNSEVETSNTAFIPQWWAIEDANTSTEKSEITITYNPDLGFKYKEINFEGAAINKQEGANMLSYKVENIPSLKREEYTPPFRKISPYVIFGLEKFHLEGVDGEASSWESFGSWYYNNLLKGTDELSDETIQKVKGVVGTETDAVKKAKLIYEYVQSKTRYISIQLGIGGWKPMLAKDVDRLGYGDCKALSNYTRALLKAVGVDAYCAVIYGGGYKRDIREDFVSMQGNHMILGIPDNDKIVWLECTSQVNPFGFQGDFTDDRMALLIKPEGSKIVRTAVYDSKANAQVSKGSYKITGAGAISANVVIASKGTQYDNKFFLESKSKDERDKYYKSGFDNINNLKIKKAELKNNKDSQEFIEDLALEAEGYCSKSGDRLIFAVNAFNQYNSVPQRYRSRKNPFEIARGFFDTDEITIVIPEGFTMESKPDDITITEKYGEYKAEYVAAEDGSLIYKRSLLVNPGYYASTDYEDFRLFREKIARNDNAKIVLIKK
ncbi:DUF3857 domain-containing protein [Flavobacterium sp. NRK1]|uniref:DUF3857 domain-containing protein n=1 Tax=Flavobacterium sp. NRK1 TaxID=2954929 RepID=UPI0020931E67|nr:DUF3857 domain-containing protein [Flavobacterium sp. NRK1]MCO6148182.1 DUF3857 domain-containing protein [Flavobacterium sp. NRK1]